MGIGPNDREKHKCPPSFCPSHPAHSPEGAVEMTVVESSLWTGVCSADARF